MAGQYQFPSEEYGVPTEGTQETYTQQPAAAGAPAGPKPMAEAATQSVGLPQPVAETAGDPGEWSSTPAATPPRKLTQHDLLNIGGAYNSSGMEGVQQYLRDNPDVQIPPEVISKIANNPNKKNETPEAVTVNALAGAIDLSTKAGKIAEQTRGQPATMKEAFSNLIQSFKIDPGSPEDEARKMYWGAMMRGAGIGQATTAYIDTYKTVVQKQMDFNQEMAKKQIDIQAKQADNMRIAGGTVNSFGKILGDAGLDKGSIDALLPQIYAITLNSKDRPEQAQGDISIIMAGLKDKLPPDALNKAANLFGPIMRKGLSAQRAEQISLLEKSGAPKELINKHVFGIESPEESQQAKRLTDAYRAKEDERELKKVTDKKIAEQTAESMAKYGIPVGDTGKTRAQLDADAAANQAAQTEVAKWNAKYRTKDENGKTLNDYEREEKLKDIYQSEFLKKQVEMDPVLAGNKLFMDAYKEYQQLKAKNTAEGEGTPSFASVYPAEFKIVQQTNPTLAAMLVGGRPAPRQNVGTAPQSTIPAMPNVPLAPSAPGATTASNVAPTTGGPAPMTTGGAATATPQPLTSQAPMAPSTGGAAITPKPLAPTQERVQAQVQSRAAPTTEVIAGVEVKPYVPAEISGNKSTRKALVDSNITANTKFTEGLGDKSKTSSSAIIVADDLMSKIDKNPELFGIISDNKLIEAFVNSRSESQRDQAIKLAREVQVPKHLRAEYDQILNGFQVLGLQAIQSVGASQANSNVESTNIRATVGSIDNKPVAAKAQLRYIKGLAEYDQAKMQDYAKSLRQYGKDKVDPAQFQADFDGPNGRGTAILKKTKQDIDEIRKVADKKQRAPLGSFFKQNQ
jgi:hypothetical protein